MVRIQGTLVLAIVVASAMLGGPSVVDRPVGAADAAPAASATSPVGPAAAQIASPVGVSDLSTTAASQPSTDDTVTRIRVYANGSARWTIEIRTRLRTDEAVESYRAFQEEFRQNTSAFLDPFADRMGDVVANAANATGREMTATDFETETRIQEVPRRWGVVSLSFRWSTFAAADGDALVVGDVFQGGYFLAENDSLVVTGPDGYEVAAVEPGPDDSEDGSVTWTGRMDFRDGHPRVRFEPAGETDEPSPAPADSTLPLVWIVGGLAAVVAGGWLYRQRNGDSPDSPGRTAETATQSDGIKTDPEQVEDLLAANGGRLRQAEIVERLDWSASKTSRVLSGMVDEGRIEKLRIGRENVVELRDE